MLETKNRTYDVIGASEPFGAGMASLIIKVLKNTPYVSLVQGDVVDLPGSHFSLIKKFVIRNYALVIAQKSNAVRAVSEKIRNDLIKKGLDREKVYVLKNRVDTRRFNPEVLSGSRQSMRRKYFGDRDLSVILYAGNLTEEKGFHDFLAFAQAALGDHENIAILVIGDGPMRREAERALQIYSDRVVFTGYIQHADIHHYLSVGDILLFTSHHEGMPRVVLEYMSMAKPIVTTPVGGVPEIIRNGENGFIVPVGEPLTLYRIVEQILANPEKAESMGIQARELVCREHELEKTLEDQVVLYKRVAAQVC